MKTLVIGYGSIGQRHTRLLKELGYQVAVVSRRSVEHFSCYPDLEQALVEWQPDYVVVANQTSQHYQALKILVETEFRGLVLIEKPLFDEFITIPKHCFSKIAVAYNLRFHPLLQELKQIVDSASKIITASVYVGSYLPNWRSQIDYRKSYSASKQAGGGVLRDLSHELDYILWMFGNWQRLTAIGGKLSQLDINSDDAYSLLMETERCPLISISMNYLDRLPRREIVINTDRQTIHVDLIQNTISNNDNQKFLTLERDATYIAEHQAMLAGNVNLLCSIEEASTTLLTIEAAEQAATLQTWIRQ
ncbi:MAG: Gfo/Idh/MocA family oxidoreductase [Symploca sp. SIO1B1]|nr:Gfo/Idh/MocA family oxidoreductase [Symploca sp. SIO1B1]